MLGLNTSFYLCTFRKGVSARRAANSFTHLTEVIATKKTTFIVKYLRWQAASGSKDSGSRPPLEQNVEAFLFSAMAKRSTSGNLTGQLHGMMSYPAETTNRWNSIRCKRRNADLQAMTHAVKPLCLAAKEELRITGAISAEGGHFGLAHLLWGDRRPLIILKLYNHTTRQACTRSVPSGTAQEDQQ